MPLMTNAKDLKDDDYETPRSAFQSILPYVPAGVVVWDPFYASGASGETLRDLGLTVIHQKEDFFDVDRGDFILTNPPFSKKKEVLTRLKALDKPFIVLLPASVLGTKMMRSLFPDIQVLVPNGRISFLKNGTQTKAVWFASFWYCWKVQVPKDITFLP
jgi:methylase of polypeptide subunit release factors